MYWIICDIVCLLCTIGNRIYYTVKYQMMIDFYQASYYILLDYSKCSKWFQKGVVIKDPALPTPPQEQQVQMNPHRQ